MPGNHSRSNLGDFVGIELRFCIEWPPPKKNSRLVVASKDSKSNVHLSNSNSIKSQHFSCVLLLCSGLECQFKTWRPAWWRKPVRVGFRVFSRFIFRVWQTLCKQLEFVCLCWCFSVEYWHNMLFLRTEFGFHPSAVQIHAPKSGLITRNVFAMIWTWDLSKIWTKVDVTVPLVGSLEKKIRSLFSNYYYFTHIWSKREAVFDFWN